MKNNEDRVKSILKKAGEYKMKKKKEGYALLTCALTVLVAVLIGTNVSPNLKHEIPNNEDKDSQEIILDEKKIAFNNLEEIELTTFKSKAELVKKMKNSDSFKNYRGGLFGDLNFEVTEDAAMNGIASAAPDSIQKVESEVTTTGGKEYSETNTQVQGVDESDIVKTNGDYIYYLYNNILRIFDNKEDKLKLVKEINYNENEENIYEHANELYLTDEYIIVFANSGIRINPTPIEETLNKIVYDWAYYGDTRNSTKILIYDVNTYELLREIETEGSYVSSRKVDDDIYMITNKYVYYRDFNEDEILPLYKDTCVASGEVNEVSIENVRCFPSFEEDSECSYMIITSLSLDRLEEKANVETFIGTGSEIYCSRDNLYVTKINYNYNNTTLSNFVATNDYRETIIRKFAIYDGEVKYVAEGSVKGSLVNQFSMDEYDKNFRITTTTGNTWDDTSENNLYVLNEELDIIGKLEGLAKGEKIYSTRFMGDKCYVVTYKTVDPLFVLDLSNPENPVVLGELKIPGYSKYLHPLGENYLIGFGEDSIEKKYKNYDGTESVTAYATGLKLAIFDITDFENPKELDSVKIGGRGSHSPLLYNHKSLLFKEDEGIFAFPATLAKEAGYYENGVPKYGDTEFNGILVFDLSTEEGISLRGKISNDDEKNYYRNEAQRVLYIEDKLYSLFGNMIKVNDIETIEEVDKIKFDK